MIRSQMGQKRRKPRALPAPVPEASRQPCAMSRRGALVVCAAATRCSRMAMSSRTLRIKTAPPTSERTARAKTARYPTAVSPVRLARPMAALPASGARMAGRLLAICQIPMSLPALSREGHIHRERPIYAGVGAVAQAEEQTERPEGEAGEYDEGERGEGHTGGGAADEPDAPDTIRDEAQNQGGRGGAQQREQRERCSLLHKVGDVRDAGEVVFDEGEEQGQAHYDGGAGEEDPAEVGMVPGLKPCAHKAPAARGARWETGGVERDFMHAEDGDERAGGEDEAGDGVIESRAMADGVGIGGGGGDLPEEHGGQSEAAGIAKNRHQADVAGGFAALCRGHLIGEQPLVAAGGDGIAKLKEQQPAQQEEHIARNGEHRGADQQQHRAERDVRAAFAPGAGGAVGERAGQGRDEEGNNGAEGGEPAEEGGLLSVTDGAGRDEEEDLDGEDDGQQRGILEIDGEPEDAQCEMVAGGDAIRGGNKLSAIRNSHDATLITPPSRAELEPAWISASRVPGWKNRVTAPAPGL